MPVQKQLVYGFRIMIIVHRFVQEDIGHKPVTEGEFKNKKDRSFPEDGRSFFLLFFVKYDIKVSAN